MLSFMPGMKHHNYPGNENQGITNPDLLADEVVSEQLTRYS